MNNPYDNLDKKGREELRKQEKEEKRQKTQRLKILKKFFLWGAVVIVIVGSILGLVKLVSQYSTNPSGSLSDVVSADDWVKGNANAKTTLVEYADFQCPACAYYYSLVKQINSDFGNKIKFVFRHFPLKAAHQNAELAAVVAEAAGLQGKFWEMHDLIFENQMTWSDQRNAKDTFIKYAQNLDLDINQFKLDLESAEIRNKINNNLKSGQAAGVNSTPTFFLNSKKLANPRSYEEFKAIIEGAIKISP